MSRGYTSQRRSTSSSTRRLHRAIPLAAAAASAFLSARSALAVDFTWIHNVGGNASGSWGDAVNWNAAGATTSTTGDTALWSGLDITADSVITLDAPRAIGNLNAGGVNNSINIGAFDDRDYSTPANWIINASSSGPNDNTNILTFANTNAANFDPITVSAYNPSVSGGALTATINARMSNLGTPGEGTFSLSKNGFGTLVLTANNSGLTGMFRIQNGTLKLDYTQAWSPTDNILGDSSANGAAHASQFQFITGTLLLQGKAGTTNSQTFTNGTSFLYDLNRLVVNSGAGGTMNMSLGKLSHNTALDITRGAILDVTLPASGNVTYADGDGLAPGGLLPIFTQASFTGAFGGGIGPIRDGFGSAAVTVNNMTDFGVDAGGGTIKASGDVGGFYTDSTAASISGNANVVGNVTLAGGTSVTSMRFNSGANTVDLGGNSVTTPVILKTAAAGASAITNGSITTAPVGFGTFTDMMVLANGTSSLTIGANITDSGGATVSLTKLGTGTLAIAGTNTNRGRTFVHAGTLVLTGTMGYRETGGNETNTEIAAGYGQTATMIINGGTLNTDRTIIGGNSDNTVGGDGTLILNTGVINSGQWFAVGNGGNGTFVNNGGTVNVNLSNGGTQMEIALFRAGKGTLIQNSGAINMLNNSNIVIGSAGATGLNNFQQQGTVIQNGGTVNFFSDAGTTLGGGGALNIGGNGGLNGGGGTFTYALNGGQLNVGAISHGGGATSTGNLILNGGALTAIRNNDAWIAGSGLQILVGGGGAKIDTSTFAVGTTLPLLHDPSGPATDGGLTKNGTGTLKLTGSTPGTYTGPTVINSGTIQFSAAGLNVQVAKYSFEGLSLGAVAQGTVVPNTGAIGASLAGTVNNNDNVNGAGSTGLSVIADGKFGQAVHFDGKGSSVDIASRIVDTSGSGSNWTMSLWMRNPQGGSTFLGKNQGGPGPGLGNPPGVTTWDVGQSQYYLSNVLPAAGAPAPDGTVVDENDAAFSGTIPVIVRHSGDFSGVTADNAIPKADNAWHMLTIVGTGDAGGNAELFYIDGTAVAIQKQNFLNADTASFSRLGKRVGFLGDGGRNFNGDMDEFSFYPISLTPAQITTLMTTNAVSGTVPGAGVLPPTTALSLTASGAVLDLNGNNQTVGSVTGVAGSIIETGAGGGRLTTGGDNTSTAFSGVIQGPGGMTKVGSGQFTLTGNQTYSGGTAVGGGTALFNTKVPTGSVTVTSGTLKVLAKGTPNSVGGTSVITSFASTGGTMDLTNNSMVIDYTGPVGTQVQDLRNHLKNGRLSSSSATTTTRLGYGDNAVLGKTTFAGVTPDSSSILVKYTYAGDADLDGDADGVDIGTWATNFTGELGGLGSSVWTQGDWDYDGDVDGVDAGLWAQAFTGELGGGGLGSIVVNDPTIAPGAAAILRGMGITVVPEPATVGLLAGIGALAMSRRSRRRR